MTSIIIPFMMLRRIGMSLTTMALLVSLASCSILPQSEPVQLLDPQLPAPPISEQSTSWTLNVTRPESDPVRDSTRVLIRTNEGQLQVHSRARWVAAGPELLRTLLVRHLRDARALTQVSSGASGSDRTLALDLRHFELVETATKQLQAEIQIEARLYDSRSTKLLSRDLFKALQPVGGIGSAQIIEGFEDVLGEIIPAIAEWLTGHDKQAKTETGSD